MAKLSCEVVPARRIEFPSSPYLPFSTLLCVVVFFQLAEFAFYSGKGYIHPPSVSMCAYVFFLITSLCELTDEVTLRLRLSRQSQAHVVKTMAAAALGGSTDTHA